MHIFRMRGDKFLRLRPQGRNAVWRIIEIDSEPVGFIVVLHPAENVIIDVAEEMDFGLNAPIVADVFEGGVFVEHAAVPAAHLVVRY